MNTLCLSLVRLCAVAVLLTPLASLRAANEHLVETLKLTRFVEPSFPAAAQQNGVAEGQVTLVMSRTPSGQPVDILVLAATDSTLAAAAVDAAREWRVGPTHDPAEIGNPPGRVGLRGASRAGVSPRGK